jgi:nucleoside-diphosphate-sugar epimerase
MPRLLAAIKFGILAVPGNGCNRVSVTHIFNFIHAVERVLESPVNNGVFNIADREHVSVDFLLRAILRQQHAQTLLLYIPRPIAMSVAVIGEWIWRLARSRHAPRLTRYLVAHIADERTLDLNNAYERLGYMPRYSIRDVSAHEDSH